MTCKEVVERLSEYWSNELDERAKDEITVHLQSCSSCQNEWAIFQAAMSALQSVTTPDPPPELLIQIQSAVMTKQPFKPMFVWRWQWAMAVGAAAIVIAFASVPLLRYAREMRSSSPYTILAGESKPLLPSPTLRQPSPPSSAPSFSFKPQPAPIKQMAKSRKLAAVERREVRTKEAERQEYSESEKLLPSSPTAELPALSIPSGERLPEQSLKDLDITTPEKKTAPQVAKLPVEPRSVPFKAEAVLEERVHVPGAQGTERMRSLQSQTSPSSQQSPTESPASIAIEPSMGVSKSSEAESQSRVMMGQHYPVTTQQLMQQYGGGLRQLPFAIPFNLRWSKFEPVVVGKVALCQLAISSTSTQFVTVFLRPGEKVKVLNAQQPATDDEEKGLVVWQDKVHSGKEVPIPILIHANEAGTRKLLVTLETMDGKTFSWWCLFPAMPHEEQPKIRRPVTLQIEQWTILDLFAHLAWETKASFLLPEEIGYRTINVPTKSLSLSEIFVLLERQIGIKWQRFGHTFSLTAPIPVPIAPMMKQQ